MTSLFPILARSGEDQWIKVVVGAVVAVFWLIGALVSAINKKAQENKRRQGFEPLPQVLNAPPLQRQARSPKLVPIPRKAQPAQRPAAVQQGYAAPIAAMPATNLSRATAATQVSHSQTAAKAAPPSQIARLLQRPDTLRAAFILNEVLSSPLALRDGHGGRNKV